MRGRDPLRLLDPLVGAEVEPCGPIAPTAARREGVEQQSSQHRVVERVVLVPVWIRVTAAPARVPRAVEAVDRGTNHVPVARDETCGELVRKGRLAGRVRSVERDAERVLRSARAYDPGHDPAAHPATWTSKDLGSPGRAGQGLTQRWTTSRRPASRSSSSAYRGGETTCRAVATAVAGSPATTTVTASPRPTSRVRTSGA
jgi:hypothetical protein